MTIIMTNIENILSDITTDKTPRTKKSIEKLNDILQAYYKEGGRDFSITTIGDLSEKHDGPGYESLRATKNTHYRRIIEAWAESARASLKKPSSKKGLHEPPSDNKLLERVSDLALRTVFAQIIAERNRLQKEVILLKQNMNIVIDKRPQKLSTESPQLSQPVANALIPMEISSLEYAISDACMQKQGWAKTPAGQVKEVEFGSEIFPRGFCSAIEKILSKK